jgi:hypothetical protein
LAVMNPVVPGKTRICQACLSELFFRNDKKKGGEFPSFLFILSN